MDARDLIAIQNLEYEESLRKDQEKVELILRKREERKEIEKNILLKKENLLVSRGGELINIKFQFSSNSVPYIFGSKDKLSDLYDFVYTQDLGEDFEIFIGHPKRLLENNNTSIESNSIENRTKLFVYFNQN